MSFSDLSCYERLTDINCKEVSKANGAIQQLRGQSYLLPPPSGRAVSGGQQENPGSGVLGRRGTIHSALLTPPAPPLRGCGVQLSVEARGKKTARQKSTRRPQRGSNSRPLVYKTSALTTELWSHLRRFSATDSSSSPSGRLPSRRLCFSERGDRDRRSLPWTRGSAALLPLCISVRQREAPGERRRAPRGSHRFACCPLGLGLFFRPRRWDPLCLAVGPAEESPRLSDLWAPLRVLGKTPLLIQITSGTDKDQQQRTRRPDSKMKYSVPQSTEKDLPTPGFCLEDRDIP
ncbi:uncharacterized protein LOC115598055 [Calypte anna]|uniref:uncharacterized protein LOC115598055 n=1 Tax=Calypte anna TaxID=9244 RepID=UPI0011C3C471|nr:uncharacterized protein LOC115598055 [Calypte anna]